MIREVYEIWDFKGNEIRGHNLENLTQAPQNATVGRIYFDTTLQKVGILLKVNNVDTWKYVPGGGLKQYDTLGDFPNIGDIDNLYFDRQYNKLYVYLEGLINDYLCINPNQTLQVVLDAGNTALNQSITLEKTGSDFSTIIDADGISIDDESFTGVFIRKNSAQFNNINANGTKISGVANSENDDDVVNRGELDDRFDALPDFFQYKGTIDCSLNPFFPAADNGFVYRVSVAGKIGGITGINVEVGDILTCLVDGSPLGNYPENWSITQANLDGAVTSGDTSATDGEIVVENGTSGRSVKKSGKKFNNSAATSNDIWDAEKILNETYDRFEIKGQLDSLHNLALLQGNIEDLGLYWKKIVCDQPNLDQYQSIYHTVSLGNGIVLAGSYGGNSYGIKVFRSEDWGETFPEIIDLDPTSLAPNTTFQILNLENGIVLIGEGSGQDEGNIWRSTDYGKTWTKLILETGLNSVFCFCSLGNKVVLAGTLGDAGEGNIWKSSDNGETWNKISLNQTTISSITYLGNKKIIVTATLGTTYSIFESIDNGDTFTLKLTLPSQINASVYLGGGVILIGCEDGSLYRSIDNGNTFSLISTAPTSIRYFTYVSCGVVFYTTSSNPNLAGAKLYKSVDIGRTWTEIVIPGMTNVVDYATKMSYAGNGLLFLSTGTYTPSIIDNKTAAIYKSSITDLYIAAKQTSEVLIGSTYFVSNDELTDDWKEGKRSFKTIAGILAQIDTNILRYTTVTGDIQAGTTITNVSDVSNIKVGQLISHANIPLDAVVTNITGSTITMSATMTASSGASLKVWAPFNIIVSGFHTVSVNMHRDGVTWVGNNAVVTFDSIKLYDLGDGVFRQVNTKIFTGDFKFIGKGTTANPYLIYYVVNTAYAPFTNGVTRIEYDAKTLLTLGTNATDYGVYLWHGNYNNNGCTIKHKIDVVKAINGKGIFIRNYAGQLNNIEQITNIDGNYCYGLTGAIYCLGNASYNCKFTINYDEIKSPSGAFALYLYSGYDIVINSVINGDIYSRANNPTFNYPVYCASTATDIAGSNASYNNLCTFNGSANQLKGNYTNNTVIVNGRLVSSNPQIQTGCKFVVKAQNTSGYYEYPTPGGYTYNIEYDVFSGGKLVLEGTQLDDSYCYLRARDGSVVENYTNIVVGRESYFNGYFLNEGKISVWSDDENGTSYGDLWNCKINHATAVFLNKGIFHLDGQSPATKQAGFQCLAGTFINKGEITNNSTGGSLTTGTFKINNGFLFQLEYGKILQPTGYKFFKTDGSIGARTINIIHGIANTNIAINSLMIDADGNTMIDAIGGTLVQSSLIK